MVSQRLALRTAKNARRGADGPGDVVPVLATPPVAAMRQVPVSERPQWVAARLRELPEPRGPRDRAATLDDLIAFMQTWAATADSIDLAGLIQLVSHKGAAPELIALVKASRYEWPLPDALLTPGEKLTVSNVVDPFATPPTDADPLPVFVIDDEGRAPLYGPATAFFVIPDALYRLGLTPAIAPTEAVVPVNLPPATLTAGELIEPHRIMARWSQVLTYALDSLAIEDRHDEAQLAREAVADRRIGTVTDRKAIEAREADLRAWSDLYASRYDECFAVLRPIYNLFQDIAAGLADHRLTTRKAPSWV